MSTMVEERNTSQTRYPKPKLVLVFVTSTGLDSVSPYRNHGWFPVENLDSLQLLLQKYNRSTHLVLIGVVDSMPVHVTIPGVLPSK